MAWSYWNWIIVNVLIGLGVVILTYTVLGILLWSFEQVFYSIVAKLFNITRCTIDVNHTVIRENTAIFTSHKHSTNTGRLSSKVTSCCRNDRSRTTLTSGNCFSRLCSCVTQIAPYIERDRLSEAASDTIRVVPIELIHNKTAQKEFIQISSIAREVASASNISQHSSPAEMHANNKIVTKPVSATTTDTSLEILRNHPSHPEYEREVLNMYGRYLTLNKKSNKFLIMTISVIVISSIIIAGIEGCFLASITVYPDGSCPIYGLMECFHGSNFTYFPCTPGNTINFTLYSNSAT
ncbi:unnamed protein product, partial [Adineta ricciae]